MFEGSHDHVLDEKGRTSLPKPYRDALDSLDGDPYLTALPHCLVILTPDAWQTWKDRLNDPDRSGASAVQRLRRLILGMADRVSVDRSGRILIPPKLRDWATLERDVVFTGVGESIELWDRRRHLEELEEVRLQYDRLTDDLK